MKVYSASVDNDYYSDSCGCHGENRSPEFIVEGAPEGTVSYALLLEDRDAVPVSKGFSWVHWAACNIKTAGLPENASADGGDFVQGLNSYTSPQGGSMKAEDCVGYCGMSPPDEDHIYTLHIYALDTELDLKDGFPMNFMFRLMRGHILAHAETDGWYRKA